MSYKYKNEKGVEIEVHTDKRGRDHVSFYDGDYIFAYNRYKTSILSLEEIYVRKELNNKLIKILQK